MKPTVTYLGPSGVTFSAIAYEQLAVLYGVPQLAVAEEKLATRNEEILSLVIDHGGYGAIAMETLAEGRVDPPMNSFIELLLREDYPRKVEVLGAIRMKIQFALMARPGLSVGQIEQVVAHPKALGACRKNVANLHVPTVEASSNGQAALEVAENATYERAAALAPLAAAERYGLTVLEESFGDREAVTTFFCLGPEGTEVAPLVETNRGLLVFSAEHQPGGLVSVLTPLAKHDINLSHVHSLYISEGLYYFAIEAEFAKGQVEDYRKAVEKAKKFMNRHLAFGPFPVVRV